MEKFNRKTENRIMKESFTKQYGISRRNRIYGIYKITSPSGKAYIGQGDIWVRWGAYLGLRCECQRVLYNALKKYGVENFKFEILVRIKETDPVKRKAKMNIMEKCFIRGFDTKAPNGYNLTDGGDGNVGYSHMEETKEKIRSSKLGVKATPEAVEANRKAQSKLHPNIGQYDKAGNLIKIWDSAAEAARSLNKPYGRSLILRVTNGFSKTAYGFVWKKH